MKPVFKWNAHPHTGPLQIYWSNQIQMKKQNICKKNPFSNQAHNDN